MLGHEPVGLQHILIGERIEPRRDAQAVVVLERGAGGGEKPLVTWLWKKRHDLIRARVNHETVGIEILAGAVIAAFALGKFLQEIPADASAFQQRAICPARVTIHTAEKNSLVFAGTSVELAIEFIDVGPGLQRQAENFQNVAAHSASGLFRLGREGRKLVERFEILTDLRRNQIDASFDGMAVGIDETGKKGLALEVHALGAFGKIADTNDLVAANSDGFGVRMFRFGGEDLAVVKDALGYLVTVRPGSRRKHKRIEDSETKGLAKQAHHFKLHL